MGIVKSGLVKNINSKRWHGWALTAALVLFNLYVQAQDGVAGLSDANTKVRSYFPMGINLMYACGAVLGLVGAIKVYTKWNQGDNDTSKVAASWFGSCIFLVVVATVIKAFFAV